MNYKSKFSRWLIVVALLFGLVQPTTTYAISFGVQYWPADYDPSSTSSFPKNAYTWLDITASEYPNAGDLAVYSSDLEAKVFYVLQIPELDADNANESNYTLTLSLTEKYGAAPTMHLDSANYYKPVRIPWTSNDGRVCDIFIVAIPEVRDYSQADFSEAAQCYLNSLEDVSILYNQLNAVEKGAEGGFFVDSSRCLQKICTDISPIIAGYTDYDISNPPSVESLQSIAQKRNLLSPQQAVACYTEVLGYYIDYCKTTIKAPRLRSLQVLGSEAQAISELEYTISLPNEVDWEKASSSLHVTADGYYQLSTSGKWQKDTAILLRLSAKDPATNTIYNSSENGIVQRKYILQLSVGDPSFSISSFQIGDRFADITGNTISLHLSKDWSWQQAPQITCSGTGYEFLDRDGNPLATDESGKINLSNAKKLRLVEDLRPHAKDSADQSKLYYTKDYILNITRGNSESCDLLSFSVGIDGEKVQWGDDGKSIIVTIPYATEWAGLKRSITCSYDATISTPQGEDFENSEKTPILYRVTAENGTNYKEYTVVVKKVAPATGNKIESFNYGTLVGVIDHEARTVSLELPAGSSVRFSPQITVPEFAVVEPASGTLQDFSSPVTYTVTAQNGVEKKYVVLVTLSSQQQENPDKSAYQGKLNSIIRGYRSTAEDDWEWMQLGIYDNKLQSEGPNSNDGFDLAKEIKDLNVGPTGTMTDIARLVMLLTSRGYDCSNLAQYNDGKPFRDKDQNEIDNLVENIYKTPSGGINGFSFGLCALDMGNYSVPQNIDKSREFILESLLSHKYLSDNWGVDMVGMIMYAIAPYQDDPVYGERVRAKLDEGIEVIIKEMRKDYTFYSWATVNSEAVAQVICALASCGVDPYSDPRFGNGETTILTRWMEMFSTSDGFKHTQDGTTNAMATYQSCYALQWYLGFLNNGGAGHPYYLYYHRYDFSTAFSTDADILSFSIDGQSGIIETTDSKNTISVTLPKGMPLQNITPDLTLSEGATLEAPDLPVTFIEGIAQPFTVLAEDGTTRKTYYVTVTLGEVDPSGARLDASSITLMDANERSLDILSKTVTSTETGADILLTVSSGIDVTRLRIAASISFGASASPVLDSSKILDLSDWKPFTVSSGNGRNSAIYRIKVQARTRATIEEFALVINGTTYRGEIDHTGGTITVTNVDDSNLTTTRIVPDITLGASTTVCNPANGIVQDFSVPVIYTVAGRNIESRTYTVRVTNLSGNPISASGETPSPSGSARIEKFVLMGVEGEIDEATGTITIRLPNGTDVTHVSPTVTVPSGAIVNPVSGEVVNLSTPITYIVTNGEESRSYIVSVVYQRSISQQLWDDVAGDNTVTDHQISRSTHRFS